jgi:hypothetical protein
VAQPTLSDISIPLPEARSSLPCVSITACAQGILLPAHNFCYPPSGAHPSTVPPLYVLITKWAPKSVSDAQPTPHTPQHTPHPTPHTPHPTPHTPHTTPLTPHRGSYCYCRLSTTHPQVKRVSYAMK